MKRNTVFYKDLINIAVPVTLQALLQSSFSVIDQLMIGQIGSNSIAGIGLGGKFASIFSVVLSAIAAAAGIMIAQYIGKKNNNGLRKSFHINLLLSLILAVVFNAVCLLFPGEVMSIYTSDAETCLLASNYLRIFSLSFLPMAATSILSVLLRCINSAVFPLFASIFSVVLNTSLNYIMIFGKLGLPAMGVNGAAFASVIAQLAACIVTLIFFVIKIKKEKLSLAFDCKLNKENQKLYAGIILPILACEFLWSLGENAYAAIYGNLGTDACAAMTMTNSIQALMMGALSGVAQASGIMVGKLLGSNDYRSAYSDSKRLMKCGIFGSLILSAALILFGGYYVNIYNVSTSIRETAYQILIVFAIISPVKVQNMILSGGIIRSGGKTKYVMWIDIIGTWLFGVPLGLVSAFVFHLTIPYVYFILSLEEVVRLLIALVLFKRKNWMNSL